MRQCEIDNSLFLPLKIADLAMDTYNFAGTETPKFR